MVVRALLAFLMCFYIAHVCRLLKRMEFSLFVRDSCDRLYVNTTLDTHIYLNNQVRSDRRVALDKIIKNRGSDIKECHIYTLTNGKCV